ncbi:restriction endonuclease subunit S [Arenibacter sp. S6351L]|uniref:restriction endonuclease subunit S n=1 Tax=Arenibacter sp. S6351L TaxID=2926407 RepID=UPI001FF33D5F|nr:restriction endonuclease subunit S [Arenibacter sp. S6351L]MCK0134837.1 restriction endonuclease subunit S [Arenibacter sp. S6351L]
MQLLKHFKELTVRPKSAQELKGLILQLAIQGKLTSNWRKENPDIEPASELLKRIHEEKKQLVKDNKIRKEKALPKITKNEISLELPKGWLWCRFDEIGVPQPGFSFKSKEFNNEGIGLPLIRIRDLHKKNIETYYSGEYRDDFLIRNGEYLVGMDGNFNIAKWNKGEALLNQRVCRLYFISSDLIKEVFVYALQFKLWALQGTKSYTTVDHLSGKQIKNSVLPFPPLEEQKEIVRVVETLFNEVEQLEQLTVELISLKEDFVSSALNQLTTNNTQQEWGFLQDHFKSFFNETTNIKKLRETVLQLAVQGKLTRLWRESHPELVSGSHHASELLKRIQKEKAQLVKEKKIKKEKALPPITKEEIPYELPEGWVWCRLGDIIKEKPRNGYSPRGVEFETQTKSLKLGATTKGVFDPSQVKYLNEVVPRESHLWLQNNDILIQRSNSLDYVGISAIYKGEDYEYVYPDLMMKIQGCTNIDTDYLHTILISGFVRQYFRDNASGTSSNMPKINQSIVLNTMIPLCNESEQKAMVKKVYALMGLCDRLEQEVKVSQEYCERLMQSCLREVFEGKKEVCV